MSIESISKKISRPPTSGMVEYRRTFATVTLGELREVYESNPTHPYGADIKKTLDAWEGTDEGREFVIDKAIIVGIIENRDVEEICEYKTGREYRTLAATNKRDAQKKEAKNGEK